MQLHTFDEVADALHGMIPDDLGPWHCWAHRYGIKVWFGPRQPVNKEHYEAQVVGARHVDGAEVLAVEIGFHAEHRKEEDNEAAIALLVKAERKWRKALGKEPVAAPFLGHADNWRRLSETWNDPDLSDPATPLELAGRLVDYVSAFEPVRRATK